MNYEGLKIYGMCLERLRYQIDMAKKRIEKEDINADRFVLECYFTDDVEDIIDILELFDIKDKRPETVKEKLDELASDLSLMMREKLEFDFNENGDLCLYLVIRK